MRPIAAAVIVGLGLTCVAGTGLVKTKPDDPCHNKNSNAEMRQCYAKEQSRVNAEADSLANKIAAEFRKESDDPSDGPVVADLLGKAASSVTLSQDDWKVYRDQHCHAVMYAWTTGSGAGTAYEACLFQLAQARLRELRSSFDADSAEPATEGRR